MVKKWIHLPSDNVDVETGEALTEEQMKKYYYITKKEKHVTIIQELDKKTYNKIKVGYIKYTNECKRTGQQRLFE